MIITHGVRPNFVLDMDAFDHIQDEDDEKVEALEKWNQNDIDEHI